jgi:hypothetical protein
VYGRFADFEDRHDPLVGPPAEVERRITRSRKSTEYAHPIAASTRLHRLGAADQKSRITASGLRYHAAAD